MKKANTIYVVGIGLAILLYFMYHQIKSESVFFYGFAENKETEINHDKGVLIKKIAVTPGQKVNKGDLLLIVQDAKIPTKISELQLKKAVVDINKQQGISKIKNKINELQLAKEYQLQSIREKIYLLEEKMTLNASLYEGLKSVSITPDTLNSTERIRINTLKESLLSISRKYDQEITFQHEQLSAVHQPAKIEQDLINTEMSHYQDEQKKLSIYAPTNGIIGSILCKEGENISAFATLLNFYQMNPTLVKGFVHESLVPKVKVGDPMEVSSSLHPQHKIKGKVTGLGSRIVEIPERLRKIPDFKTYGREVIIQIPPQNNFLQKEKVMLNTSTNGKAMSISALELVWSLLL